LLLRLELFVGEDALRPQRGKVLQFGGVVRLFRRARLRRHCLLLVLGGVPVVLTLLDAPADRRRSTCHHGRRRRHPNQSRSSSSAHHHDIGSPDASAYSSAASITW